jgi:hypothetical protein
MAAFAKSWRGLPRPWRGRWVIATTRLDGVAWCPKTPQQCVLGIMRACLETQKLEQLEARMDEIANRVARGRTNAARERTSHP